MKDLKSSFVGDNLLGNWMKISPEKDLNFLPVNEDHLGKKAEISPKKDFNPRL